MLVCPVEIGGTAEVALCDGPEEGEIGCGGDGGREYIVGGKLGFN